MKNKRLPQGLSELSLEESRNVQELTDKLFAVLKKEGFSKIEPSQIDFAKNLEMEQNSSDSLFKSIDTDGKLLAFSGDSTPSIMRFVEGEQLVQRVYFDRLNYSFIPNKNGNRVSRECGAQLYGIADTEGDAEIITACYDSLVQNGIKNLKITVSHAFLFKSIIYSYKPTEDITTEDIRVLIETGLCDKLNEVCIAAVTTIAKQKGDIKVLQEVAEGINNREAIDCLLKLFEIYQILAEYGLDESLEFDFGYMPSASYYNGIVFKISNEEKKLAQGGHFSGTKFASAVIGTGFKYNINNIISIINAESKGNDTEVILGIANSIAALNKARKIKLSLMESDVRINTLYKVTKAECYDIALQCKTENVIYINDKGELEE
ncbi:MAG TPA: ATP phosphoribosyltransferase regulatory subunit [Clostridia bacterium]|nr:ATP phosphoribosyltransferase regulatory subunit [Clostridia bacterium]